MAKVVHPENSKYFIPAKRAGQLMGLSKARCVALALRVVSDAANGRYEPEPKPYWMASSIWEDMGMVKVTKEKFHGEEGEPGSFAYTHEVYAIPASIVNYVIKTRESTWKKWEAVARAMGLV